MSSSPPRPVPSRRQTRSPPVRRASLLTPSVAAPSTAATTSTHFPPFLPTSDLVSAPSTSASITTEDPASSSLFSPPVSFPSVDPATIWESPMAERERRDSEASLKKRPTIFSALSPGSIRRKSTSGSVSDGSGGSGSLASLLQTQKRDQAARRLHKDRPDGNTSGVASESESDSPAKKSGAVKRTLTRVLSSYRKRKTSNASATAVEEPSRAASTDSATQTSPVVDTSASPAKPDATEENLMSPVVEEAAAAPPAAENEITLSPEQAAVDLGSAPSSPVGLPPPEQNAISIPPPEEIAALDEINESGVLVPGGMDVEVEEDHVSSRTKMTAVSSAAADSKFQSRKAEQGEDEDDAAAEGDVEDERDNEHDADWEQVHSAQQRALLAENDDAGSLADESGSSIAEPRPRTSGLSALAALREKGRGGIADSENASTNGQMGEDATDPSERVPGTPFLATTFGRDVPIKAHVPSALAVGGTDFTPPITPASEKFPELKRLAARASAASSTLATSVGERALPGSAAGGGKGDQTEAPVPAPAAAKDESVLPPAIEDGEGGLSNFLPSRETAETAAQYTTPTPQQQPQDSHRVQVQDPSHQDVPAVRETAGSSGYYDGFNLPSPARLAPNNTPLDAATTRPVSYYTSASAPLSTTSSPPNSPFVTAFHTSAIALRQFHTPGDYPRSRTMSAATATTNAQPSSPPPPPPARSYSLWDLTLLPITVPIAATRIALSYSFRAFVFGVVFGVTMVRMGSHAIGSAFLGRQV